MAKFLKLKEACSYTGLSVHYLREGCKAGTIPHIRAGTVYLIDIDLFVEQLHAQSTEVKT